jgi:iron complex outermembrane receptor protein
MTKNRVRGVIGTCLPVAGLTAGLVLLPAGTAAMAAETADGAFAGGLEEIVVTARKREEKLQDAPISISAYSAERLEAQGVSETTQLQDFTPNLVFQNTPSNSGVGSSAAVFIRGIGQKDFAPTTDPGVGIYVDGVYLARTVGGVFDMIDVDRVEVLRGPQGTLFGRNTIGGAISIVTAKPDSTFGAKADVTTGTDNRIDVRGTLNIPLSDTFFARVSGGSFKQDGYVRRTYDGRLLGNKDEQTGRLALRWLAADGLEINLTGDFSRDRTNGPPVVVAEVDSPAANPGSIASLANFLAAGNPALCFEAANYNNPACLGLTRFGTQVGL